MGHKKARARGRPRKKDSPLSRWVDASGLTRDEAALRFGTTRPHLDRLCRGDRRPSLALALKIERLTEGAVPVAAWTRVPPHSSD